MNIRVGCTTKDYFVNKGSIVIASWSLQWSDDITVGNIYEIKGISSTKNLIIENNKGKIEEYSPVHFRKELI